MFALNKYVWPGWIEGMGNYGQAWTIATPVVLSIVLFIVIGWLKPENTERTDALVDSLADDGPVTDWVAAVIAAVRSEDRRSDDDKVVADA